MTATPFANQVSLLPDLRVTLAMPNGVTSAGKMLHFEHFTGVDRLFATPP